MIDYYLNNVPANPKERQQITFSAIFDGRRFGEYEMKVKNITFVREDYDLIKQWISSYGYGVGMPFDVKFSNGSMKRFILDFSDATFRNNSCTISAIPRFENDTFFKKAEGLTFTNGGVLHWNNSDFVEINYVVVPKIQLIYLISVAVATLTLGKELAESIERIGDDSNAVIKAATPVGAPIPGPDWGAIIIVTIKLLLTVAYTTAIIIALVQMIVEIVNIVFPKIRQFKAIDYYHLIEKCCNALGFSFQSTFLQNKLSNMTVLPVPLKKQNTNFFQETFTPNTLAYTNGYPSSQDSIRTLDDAIRVIETVFNCRTRVKNGTVRIEQASYWQQNTQWTNTHAFDNQEDIEDEYTVNIDEQFKRKVIVWDFDSLDYNTMDDTIDTSSEIANIYCVFILNVFLVTSELLATKIHNGRIHTPLITKKTLRMNTQ